METITRKKIIISGQQRIRLNKYIAGKIQATDLYGFLSARVNEIPYNLVENGSDHECIMYISDNSIVDTNVHEVINWWAKFYKEYNIKRCDHFCSKIQFM